ncbi:MAG: DUF5320 domain-containing protein [Euryarchaeota archaeon]|nr:DUF5320 domain-containing protein [Euryarchaeota archaeon]
MNGWYGEGIDSPYYWGRCRRFPWLPRWWWAMPATPYTPPAPAPVSGYAPPVWTEEQELAMLESHAAMLGQQLEQIKKILEEVKK